MANTTYIGLSKLSNTDTMKDFPTPYSSNLDAIDRAFGYGYGVGLNQTVAQVIGGLSNQLATLTNTAYKTYPGSPCTMHYHYEQGSASTTFDLPTDFADVYVTWANDQRATVIAIRWDFPATNPAQLWIRAKHNETWGEWQELANANSVAMSGFPIAIGTIVQASTNFNSFVAPGNYTFTQNVIVAGSANRPSDLAGRLCVWTLDGTRLDSGAWKNGMQIYYDIDGHEFRRTVSTNGSSVLSFGQWTTVI